MGHSLCWRLSFGGSWFAEGGCVCQRPAPWHPQPLGLAQQCPLAWLWEGTHQAHGPTVGTATIPPMGVMGLQDA